MTRAVLASLLTVLMLSGCTGLRLYSETRDKQGQAASKAWSEVDLRGFFAVERENRAKVLEQELSTSQRRIAADRDLEVRQLAKAPVAQFPCYYDRRLSTMARQVAIDDEKRLEQLVKDPCPMLPAEEIKNITDATLNARSALRSIGSFTGNLERRQSFWRQKGIPIFGCPDLLAVDFKASAASANVQPGLIGVWMVENAEQARQNFGDLRAAASICSSIRDAGAKYRKALAAFPKGDLKTRVSILEGSEEALAEEHKTLSARQSDYAKALADYKKEVEAQRQGKSTAEKVKDLAAKVEQAIDAIEKVQVFLSEKFLSEERIKRIDELLGRIKEGKQPAEDASKTEISIFYLPMLADDIRAIEAAQKGRGAVPLLIKRDIEQARLNAATTVLAAKTLDIELQRAAIESSLTEIRSILDARATFLTAPKGDNEPLGLDSVPTPFFSSWDKLSNRQKYALLQSASLYLDSVGRQRAITERLDRTRFALALEEASSLSEVNASMWTSLIGASVAQAAEYSALGLKASDFQGILSTLGILWIGYGTNR